MSGFNDHGNAFKSEGFETDYAPPPAFSVHSHTDVVGRLAYEMQQEAQSAAIHANRLERLCAQVFADEAYAKASAELNEAMDACAKAIADAVEKLTRART